MVFKIKNRVSGTDTTLIIVGKGEVSKSYACFIQHEAGLWTHSQNCGIFFNILF